MPPRNDQNYELRRNREELKGQARNKPSPRHLNMALGHDVPYVSFFEAIPQLTRLLELLWSLTPIRTLIMLTGNFTKSLLPALDLRIRARLIHIINRTITRDLPFNANTLGRLLVLQLGSLIFKNLLETALLKNQHTVNSQLSVLLKRRLLDAHLRLDTAALMVPETQAILNDALTMASPNYLSNLVKVNFNLINSLTDITARIAATTQTISLDALPYFLLYSIVPLAQIAYSRLRVTGRLVQAAEGDVLRKADIASIAFDTRARREVSLFGLQSFIATEYSIADGRINAKDDQNFHNANFGARILEILSSFSNPAIYAFLAWKSQSTQISLADLHLIENTTSSLISTSDRTILTQQASSNVLSHLINYYKALELQPALPVPKVPIRYSPAAQGGMTVEFREVSFRYSSDGPLVLDNVSFTIRAGTITALVGYNGSGKSTIIALLARVYDPTSGVVYLNGRDLRQYDTNELWQHMSFTHQDFARWPLTGLQNISVGKIGELDSRKIENAARATGAFEVLNAEQCSGEDSQPGKEDKATSPRRLWDERLSKVTIEMQAANSTLNENPFRRQRSRVRNPGVELSGGQWQKIALARSFLREADLLVLDEPSANLDPRAEHELFTNLINSRKGRTTLFITHRLGVVRASDDIVFLEQGQVKEHGSHEELMKHENGAYRHLVEIQTAGFNK